MYKKELQIPHNLLELIAFKRRSLFDHPKVPLIEKSYNKLKKGFMDEKKIEYQLHYLNPEKYFIFHAILYLTNRYVRNQMAVKMYSAFQPIK
ncbi:hypothetical protein [Alkalihalobacillus sp. TS-13]|uniref:hypothetical protein n=1 Tax=Alkalihalobacillus sp. TS-13 TaxID=2842455 RepID=UPI001C8896B6|nr:hypothetical protein [Alkalihalobacillus sp. TS-13]